MDNLVVKARLREGSDDAFFNLSLIVDEVEVTESFEGTLLDELLACTMAYSKSVQSLLDCALSLDKLNTLLSVPDSSVSQQEDMRGKIEKIS